MNDADLVEARRLLQPVYDACSDAAFLKDAAGFYRLANGRMAEWLGADGVEQLIGRRDEELLPPEAAGRAAAVEAEILLTGRASTAELENRGDRLLFRREPWRDGQGRVIGVIGIGSEPPRLETGASILRETQELLDLAQEVGGVGIFEWLVQAGTVRLSSSFLSLCGMTDFDGRYESWIKCIDRDDLARIEAQLQEAFSRQAKQDDCEFRVVSATTGAVRWLEARNVIYYDADGAPVRVVGVNVDVTGRKDATLRLQALTETLEERVRDRTRALEAENEARMKAEEALRQSQKMDAVGQLTGGIAHDFNNLLSVIIGNIETLQRRAQLEDPGLVRRLELALRAAERASTLTLRLLAFSRRQPLEPKPTNVNTLVTGMSDLLNRSLGEIVAIETVLAEDLRPVSIDANQLESAILNIAVNARDAMPSGGTLSISTANADFDEAGSAPAADLAPGRYVLVALQDTGSGMPADVVARAFEPFFTTKDVGQGTGLGLSQVYGFIKQSQGHVKIASEPGCGTTVILYLPQIAEAGAVVEPAPLPPEGHGIPMGLPSEKILIVEDDEDVRRHATEIVREIGYGVFEAANAANALEVLAAHPDIGLLFTDVGLPGGLNGRQLADRARQLNPALKVLFTTGYARDVIVHQGRLDEGVELIVKPLTFASLALRIRQTLDAPG